MVNVSSDLVSWFLKGGSAAAWDGPRLAEGTCLVALLKEFEMCRISLH